MLDGVSSCQHRLSARIQRAVQYHRLSRPHVPLTAVPLQDQTSITVEFERIQNQIISKLKIFMSQSSFLSHSILGDSETKSGKRCAAFLLRRRIKKPLIINTTAANAPTIDKTMGSVIPVQSRVPRLLPCVVR